MTIMGRELLCLGVVGTCFLHSFNASSLTPPLHNLSFLQSDIKVIQNFSIALWI